MLAYFGHHKCASTWITLITKAILAKLNKNYFHFSNEKHFEEDVVKIIHDQDPFFLFYTNADYEIVKRINFQKGFHVIRDPRDVILSGYFSHKNSHYTEDWPELIEHRKKLNKLSFEKGLTEEILFSKRFIMEMYDWDYNFPGVIHIKMEDLITDPYKTFYKVFQFLGLIKNNFSLFNKNQISPLQLKRIINGYRFEKLTKGRKIGNSNPHHHFRKGIPGDWKNYFNEDHITLFNKTFPNVLSKLHYQ